MKAKTIKTVLRKKMDEWLKSIDDESVRELVAKNTIISGGCIASMLLKEPVNDFDLYFRNRETTLAVARYYVKRFCPKNKKGVPCKISVDDESQNRIKIVIKSAGIASEDGSEKPYEYFESQPEGEAEDYVASVMQDPGEIQDTLEETEAAAQKVEKETDKPRYRPVFLSTNAITLSDRIQIVLRFFGEPDEIHANYDFVHCTNYWTSHDGELVLRPKALEALLSRELVYVGSKYPVCSIMRIRKFMRRGWSINAGQVLKACMQISDLNLRDINVLQDQLTGVDCAYFCEVLSRLREKDADKVNSAYLIEIIDRMF